MMDSITPFLNWLNAHPHLAGFVTFIICAIESIAILGTIIPGAITMAAIGTLIGAGVIPLWSTFVWATVGAAVGDNVSYWFGFYFKNGLRRVWPFRSYPQWIKSGEDFFHRHGMKSVVIGRFVGPLRAIVPLVAGMMHMKPPRFIIISFLASAVWAPIYMLPGILLGEATMELPPDIAAQMVLRLVLLGLFIAIAIWIVYRIFILIKNQVDQFLNFIWRLLLRSRYFHIVTTVLKHHNIKKTHGQLVLAFYLILSTLAFIYLSLYVLWNPSPEISIDKAIHFSLRGVRNPFLDNLMIWFTILGEKKVLLSAALGVFGWVAWKKHWRTAWHIFILMILTVASLTIFKNLIHSPRPWGIINSPDSFSFPSGHTTMATTFYFGLGLFLLQFASTPQKRIGFTLIGFLVAIISFSRLYLGAHWFTDVLGGWLLGAILLMLIAISYNRKSETPLNVKMILVIAVSIVFLGSSILHHYSYKKFEANYELMEWPIQTTDVNTWWSQKNNELPFYRIGLFGVPVELLNIQWLGNINEIKTLLLSQGWEFPIERGWIDVLPRLTDIGSAEHLPIISPLYFDKKPVLELIKKPTGEKKPIVLRLWSSNTAIRTNNPDEKLWVGAVGPVPRTYSWLINYKKNNHQKITPNVIFDKLPTNFEIKEQPVTTDLKHKHRLQTIILIKPK